MAARSPAQLRVGQEGGGDDHAVAEVVDAVAQQHAPATAAGLLGVEVVGGGAGRRLRGGGCGGTARPSPAGRRTAARRAASQEQLVRCGLALEGLGQHVQQRVPSSTPADRLTRCLTRRPSSRWVSAAAISTDSTPPARVASTMDSSVMVCAPGGMAGPQLPDRRPGQATPCLNQARQRFQPSSACSLR
jgi:hypothetical protein